MNCLQNVRSSGPGTTVCKSRATHRALITGGWVALIKALHTLCITSLLSPYVPFPLSFAKKHKFFSFFFCIPSCISEPYHLGENFCVCNHFFFYYPTIEIATFCFRGWCMLDVFLLPAFARLGHECQDLLSLHD